MSRVRVVFFGTPEIARHCLSAMLQDEHYEIVGVVSQPDRPAGRKLRLTPSPVKELALARGLRLITPERASAEEVIATLRDWNAEVAVVVAFGQILKKNLLDLYPRRVVNVHASLLPRWRGAAPMQRALMAGDERTGVCLQVMVRKLDAGPVLGQRIIELDDQINAADLYARVQDEGAKLLAIELMDYMRGNLSPVPQDEARVTLAPKIEKSEAEIDWKNSARITHNLIRGLSLGPVAQTTRAGQVLKIHRARVCEEALPPGLVSVDGAGRVRVGCGAGSLELLEVQPASRARMPIGEYRRGYPFEEGCRFGSKSVSDRA